MEVADKDLERLCRAVRRWEGAKNRDEELAAYSNATLELAEVLDKYAAKCDSPASPKQRNPHREWPVSERRPRLGT